MDTRKLIEAPSVPEETQDATNGVRTDAVKLVEMGDISVETKGAITKGLELGFFPKY